jgi:hypothetical protein
MFLPKSNKKHTEKYCSHKTAKHVMQKQQRFITKENNCELQDRILQALGQITT